MYKILASIGLSIMLTGCMSTGPVGVDRVITDIERDGVTITGRYDPSGFTTAEVQRLVSNVCTRPGIMGYSEAGVEGQTAFRFTCANGNSYGPNAGINFTRTGAGSATYSAVFADQSGNLASASGAVRF